MASFDDLGSALRQDAAENAPRASAIDLDAVTRAARARRLPRQWAVGTLSLVAVLGVGGLAVAAVTPPSLIAASESADLEAGTAEEGAAPLADDGVERSELAELGDLVACGAATMPAESNAGDLTLELRLTPNPAPAGSTVAATAVLINEGPAAITVTTGVAAVAVLTQSGTVVGSELPREGPALEFELSPGQSRELPTLISTLDCRGAANETLAPGRYRVTAVLDVIDSATGARVLVIAPSAEIRLD